ncbi:hypothetical protein TNIN_443291 [Trichonephila inaurata madagascariensis]|uniref:DUF5641 domain-containing protein n=1 Tax=Trichonephila inaurata madagascariensis TaxID=2747483 RepID=A0A8X6WZS3_9ARAC|nr:hypothetical protein TNIN_443291 [Trichonephila inaurata madagascariensis]
MPFPEPHTAPDSFSSSRWSLIQRLRDTFWARWSSEYLNELQRRNEVDRCERKFEDRTTSPLKKRKPNTHEMDLSKSHQDPPW